MAITSSQLVVKNAATNNNTPSANGGLMTDNTVSSAAANNVFDNVTQTERTDGNTTTRKIFLKNESTQNLVLTATKIFLDNITGADDSMTFLPGTATDVQSDATSNVHYGCGTMGSDISIGATSITVTVENDQAGNPLSMFVNGQKLRITDKATVNAVSGKEEYVTIDGAVGAPAGSLYTIPITATANAYLSAGGATRVMNVYEPGDLDAAISPVTLGAGNIGSGTFSDAGISPGMIGAIDESWELRFGASTTVFELWKVGTVTEDTTISGTVGVTFSPTNTPAGGAYFTISDTLAFGGTFSIGDVVEITTTSATKAIWLKRQVTAGTDAFSANSVPIAMDGESA